MQKRNYNNRLHRVNLQEDPAESERDKCVCPKRLFFHVNGYTIVQGEVS
jgi:hypothetical protein